MCVSVSERVSECINTTIIVHGYKGVSNASRGVDNASRGVEVRVSEGSCGSRYHATKCK